MVSLSILIPVYNVEKYLGECLDSILVKNAFEGEVICVDDGSTDRSSGILTSYAERFKNLKVLRQENMGMGAARNAALKIATGDYVLFVDSDDLLADNAIMAFLSIIDGEDILYYNVQRFWDTDGTQMPIVPLPDVCKIEGKRYYEEHYIRKDFMPCVSMWGGGYKRSFLLENNLFNREDVTHGEDEDFYPRALFYAGSISTTNNVLYRYRLRNDSMVRKPSPRQNTDFLHVASSLLDFFNEKNWINSTTMNAVYYLYYTMIYNTQYYNLNRPKEYNIVQIRKMLSCSTSIQDRRTTLVSIFSFNLALKYHSYTLPKFQRNLINLILH